MNHVNKTQRSGLGNFGTLALEEKLAAADGVDYGKSLAARLRRREQQHLRQSGREAVLKTARQHQHLAECHRLALQVLGRARVAMPPSPARADNVPQLEDQKIGDPGEEEDLSDLLQVAHFARVRRWELECEQLLERLIAAYPERSCGLLGLGLLRIDQERYSQARACFEQVLRQSPGNALAHGWLGVAMLAENRIPAAAEVFVGLVGDDGVAGALARAMLKAPQLIQFTPRPPLTRVAARSPLDIAQNGATE
jgi:tetratricopeptide (TPR) repeat protein